MADVTLMPQGGTAQDVQEGDLLLPLVGAWTAHLTLAHADAAPTGRVTLSWLGTTLEGYVLRSGESEGRPSCLVTGGRGGLWKAVQPKMYDYQLAVSLPLKEILQEAGEQLSPKSTAAILTRTLPNWVRRLGECGQQLNHLADAVGALWSVEPDGSLFFGVDDWPAAEAFEHDLLAYDPAADMAVLSPLQLGLWPGDRYGGRKVGTVHYHITPEQSRARVWYLREEAGPQEDPLRVGLEALVRETMRGVDLYAAYPGRVVTQRANGTLDVILDSTRLPPLTSVPYRVPVPGAKLTVPSGSRVLVSFAGGDPTRYFAELYEPGGATRAAARVDDTVQVDLWLLTAPVGIGTPPALVVVGISPVPVPPPATAVKVTLTLGKITSGSPYLALP